MQSGPSRWKRRLLIAIAGFVFLAMLLFGAWPLVLKHFAIEQLSWQGLGYGQGQWRLKQLNLVYSTPSQKLQINAQDLSWKRSQHALRIGQLALSYEPSQQQPEDSTPLSLPADLRQWLPTQLPRSTELEHVSLLLPCKSGQCSLQGHGQLLRPSPHIAQLYLGLEHDSHQLRLEANLYGDSQAPEAIATIVLDEQPRISLQHRVSEGLWQGQLIVAQLPEMTWLLPWIEQWIGPQPKLQQVPEAQLDFIWKLQHPAAELQLTQVPHLRGDLQASVNLSHAWPLPNVGLLQGQAQLALDSHSGVWQARTLSADLQLEPNNAAWLHTLPKSLHPKKIALQISPLSAGQADTSLPFTLQMQVTGPLQLEAQAQALLVADSQQPSLDLQQATLSASSAALQWGTLSGRKLQAQLAFSAQISPQELALQLGKGSVLKAAQLDVEAAQAEQLSLTSEDLQAQLIWPTDQALDYQITGSALFSSQKIMQAQLKAQAWQWPTTLQLTPQQLQLTGQLSNHSGLKLPISLSYNDTGLSLTAQASSLSLSPSNPLQASLSAWPALLETQQGQLLLKHAHYRAPRQGDSSLTAELQLKGVSGIYDRSEFSQLSGALVAEIQQNTLKLSSQNLNLERLNSGIGIGPLSFVGHYEAPLSQAEQGQVRWQTARVQALGGQVWAEPSQLRLGQANSPQKLYIKGLEIEQLLKAYPAEGLQGVGIIDGELPVVLSAKGLSIAQGSLKAREPGGRLQFQSAKLNALGRNNPAMKLVVDALHDFHYHTLQSGVNYSEQGQLQLALRLEGSNPSLENGRPIHLNVNLEEDIPALLTSLQLSNKVSERIQQRVQQRIKQNASPP